MTKHELQQIRYYDSELRILRLHLADLEDAIGISGAPSDGQPKGNKIGRPTESQAIALAQTIKDIRTLEEKITVAKSAAWKYIASIDDALLRQIITLRFIDCKSWYKVSEAIGGETTADGCRMTFSRANIDD